MLKNWIVFLSLAALVQAQHYHVAVNGDDNWDGTSAHPFRSIQHGLDQLFPGDTLSIGAGRYFEMPVVTRFGSSASGAVVIQAETGDEVIVDGSQSIGGDDEPALLTLDDAAHVCVRNITFENLTAASDDEFPAGIWIRGASHDIVIEGCRIFNIVQPWEDAGGAHGLAVYGSSADSAHAIVIRNCEIAHCRLGWSEALTFNGNVSSFEVTETAVHNCDNIGFDFIGHEATCPLPELDQARFGLIAGNRVWNIDSRTNAAYDGEPSAAGFYVDGGRQLVLERNSVLDCNIGIEIASEHGGRAVTEVVVRSNVIARSHVLGISVGGYDKRRGPARDIQVLHNTLYDNNVLDLDWGASLQLAWYCESSGFINNLIVMPAGGVMLRHETGSGSENIIDCNGWFGDGESLWCGEDDCWESFEGFQAATGFEDHGLWGDPGIRDAGSGDWSLSEGSTAIDAGLPLPSRMIGELDYYGQQRVAGAGPDLGACERQPEVAVYQQKTVAVRTASVYPNPFHERLTVVWTQAEAGAVRIGLYNLRGQLVHTLFQGDVPAGRRQFLWQAEVHGQTWPAGLYTVSLRQSARTEVIHVIRL